MGAFYRKELKSYFNNMTGFVFLAFILLMTGIFFTAINLNQLYPKFEIVISNVSFIFLLVVPILTMRSVAEEKHLKTDQLLYSLPVPVTKIVIAKYLAMVSVFLISVGVMLMYPVVLSFFGDVSFLSAYSALAGFAFLGCALISIGMFMSSLTESQLISSVISFGVLLIMYLMTSLASIVPNTAIASFACFTLLIAAIAAVLYFMTKDAAISIAGFAVAEFVMLMVYLFNKSLFEGAFASFLKYFSVFDRLENFIYGIFDLTAIVYYLSIIFIFVFMTVQSVEKKRWS
ncbi:MAG: ABC transporter [Ruminococcaceae bacterium]|nr:ABC transporter [Oscillospiraceae bacterium]